MGDFFKAVTKTRCTVQTTLTTTFGVLRNKHYGVVDSEVVLDDLFGRGTDNKAACDYVKV